MRTALYKRKVEQDVYTLACERVEILYKEFDHVSVSFSGGKDSTAVLNVCLDVARAMNKLPVYAVFYDEEALDPLTIEYMTRVAKHPDVSLRWLCLPVRARNACSRKSPFWWPWAEEDRKLWCRPLPKQAIRTLPGFQRQAIPLCAPFTYSPKLGRVAEVLGIRTQESLRRYQAVTARVYRNWLSVNGADVNGHIYAAKPVYDWMVEDVWTAPKKFGWDWNRAYDMMTLMGMSRFDQRICPPYAEEPLQSLWKYAQGWPDLWEKMLKRVPGAAVAARFARSPMYVYGKVTLSEGCVPREMIEQALGRWPIETARKIRKVIQAEFDLHMRRTHNVALLLNERHPISGCSWAHLYFLAVRGDLRGRHMARKYVAAVKIEDELTTAEAGTRY